NTVVRAESTTTSWLGTERTLVERMGTGYRASVDAIDGARTESTLASEPLPPSERLASTALALCLAAAPASPVRLLSVDDESAQVVTAVVTSESDENYQVLLSRSGTVGTQRYELEPDGRVRRLSGTAW